MQLSAEEFVKRLPTIDTLITTYHVPTDAAFFLCRPQYTYAINVRTKIICDHQNIVDLMGSCYLFLCDASV
jgi:hypothetical protein